LTFLAVLGPGIVVMLADTDVGSVVTAAQSGIQWGYRLLWLQIILVPILYIVQELTVRLGIFTGKGHSELIRATFGPAWAWISVSGLAVAVMGAIVTEFAGIAGVGELFGIPRWISLVLVVGFLLIVVWTGTYRRVERVAVALGLFELAFVVVAIAARPDARLMVEGLTQMPLGNASYLYLVLANIGAIIMPWMIFYQQSAVVDKRLQPEHYRAAQADTAIGAVVTQLIMAAVLISTAATIGQTNPHGSLNTVGQIVNALIPYLGTTMGKVVFCLGIIGAGMVSAIVVSLAMAWAFGEVMGYKHSLEHRPLEAPLFYLVYSTAVLGGTVLVVIVPDLVTLSIAVQVMNALLLPLVLGLLVALATKVLPQKHRLHGGYRLLIISVAVCIMIVGIVVGLQALGLFF
jgi:NRAMP (natural resistance-associated macrophage protein)-like metal ion transporter